MDFVFFNLKFECTEAVGLFIYNGIYNVHCQGGDISASTSIPQIKTTNDQ